MATSPTIAEGGDQMADAAAGGFDDFIPPPAEYREREVPSYRQRERRNGGGDNGSNSSSGREKQREGQLVGSGLNQPRNPMGANVFVQSRQGTNPF
jgi:hypothetical protein